MIRRALGGVLTACALLLTGLVALPSSAVAGGPQTAPVQASAAQGPALGSQIHMMWGDYTDAERIAALDQLKAHGVEWVRLDVSWAMLQPHGRDEYSSWGVSFVDRVVDMAVARGLKPLVMLWMTPEWANGGVGERHLPTDVQDYARVAEWAAARWAGKVHAWEVWNEPNLEHFLPGTDAAAYTRLLKAAYPAFHRGDPSTTVLFAGVVYNDTAWIERAYAAGAAGHFDAMATHPYQAIADLPPEHYDGTKWTLRHAHAVHELMKRYGDGHKPIWFTEFGWSDHGNRADEPNWSRGVTQAQQADYLVRAVDLVAAEMPFVTNMFWYNERNRADDGVHNNNYGLMTRDLQPKPVLLALRDYVQRRGTATPEAPAGPAPTPCERITTAVTPDVALCPAVSFSR